MNESGFNIPAKEGGSWGLVEVEVEVEELEAEKRMRNASKMDLGAGASRFLSLRRVNWRKSEQFKPNARDLQLS